jgi:N-succinyldiaminopimelate aminotransferase
VEDFQFDTGELRAAFSSRTKAIVINTPHNPTGKVFSRSELALIAELCVERGVIAITDEVYENLTFEARLPHISIAALPGMPERTVTLSSLGKSFSLTGWKIGWAVASAELTAAVRAAHQFIVFCSPSPLQHGAAAALRDGDGYVAELRGQLREARDYLGRALEEIGFTVYWPAGTYFIMVDHAEVGRRMAPSIDPPDDAAFCRRLTQEVGVAAIPPSPFYDRPEHGRRLARFAFCKKRATLEEAVRRLRKLA